jgi:hypothetical protein
MNRRTLLSIVGITLAAGTAQASLVSYAVIVNTPGISAAPGYIELQFNQANAVTSGIGAATVTQFLSTGYTLGGSSAPSAGVTGSFASPPLVIPNDQSAANYYDEIVTTWGQSFRFHLTVDTAATDSGFFVFLLDSGFSPIVGPLSSGEVANVIIDAGGRLTQEGSTFAGGSATVAQVPEPAAAWLLAPGLGALLLAFRRKH